MFYLSSKYFLINWINFPKSIQILGSIFTWGDIHDYQISYLRYKGNTDIDFKSGFFFMPIALLVDKLFIFFGAQWEAKFGARL